MDGAYIAYMQFYKCIFFFKENTLIKNVEGITKQYLSSLICAVSDQKGISHVDGMANFSQSEKYNFNVMLEMWVYLLPKWQGLEHAALWQSTAVWS